MRYIILLYGALQLREATVECWNVPEYRLTCVVQDLHGKQSARLYFVLHWAVGIGEYSPTELLSNPERNVRLLGTVSRLAVRSIILVPKEDEDIEDAKQPRFHTFSSLCF